MSSTALQRLTAQEYLAFERASERKHEFYDGQVFAMAGTGLAHVKIVRNLLISIGKHSQAGCEGLGSDMRVKVAASGLYTYPDVSILCGQSVLEDSELDTLLNPKVIFEVLSPSTERYDRGRKFALYQGLDTLTDYILVAQDMARVEHYEREDAGHWRLSVYDSLSKAVLIPSVGCELPLVEIYESVEFGPPPPLRDVIDQAR